MLKFRITPHQEKRRQARRFNQEETTIREEEVRKCAVAF